MSMNWRRGWLRIGAVLSVAWVLLVAARLGYELTERPDTLLVASRASAGGVSEFGTPIFVLTPAVRADAERPDLSKFGAPVQDAEQTGQPRAKRSLAEFATDQPEGVGIDPLQVAVIALVPVAAAWLLVLILHAAIGWIVVGFRGNASS